MRWVAQGYKAAERGGVNPKVCACIYVCGGGGAGVCVYMSVCYESMTWWPPCLLA